MRWYQAKLAHDDYWLVRATEEDAQARAEQGLGYQMDIPWFTSLEPVQLAPEDIQLLFSGAKLPGMEE